mmetsp:Transcript_96080/g.213957  ORF Transcript_96080/g.213957 Transcript_96080/m.213957 type:complete len:263 (+) Transcript_96080:351-1139(+)
MAVSTATSTSALLLNLVEVATRCRWTRPAQRLSVPELLEQHHGHGRGPVGDLQMPLNLNEILLPLNLIVAREDVSKLRLRLVVKLVLLGNRCQFLVRLDLADEGALIHLPHLHHEQPSWAVRPLEDIVQPLQILYEGGLPLGHDVGEAQGMAFLDVKVVAELLDIWVDPGCGVRGLRRLRSGLRQQGIPHDGHGQEWVRRQKSRVRGQQRVGGHQACQAGRGRGGRRCGRGGGIPGGWGWAAIIAPARYFALAAHLETTQPA